MKIVIPGGSGQIGTVLARALIADGHEVVVLSRKLAQAAWRFVKWDGESLGGWVREIDGADVVMGTRSGTFPLNVILQRHHERTAFRLKPASIRMNGKDPCDRGQCFPHGMTF